MRSMIKMFTLAMLTGGLAACGSSGPNELSFEEEIGFRLLRQDYHVATTTGDFDLLRSIWANDAVLTTDAGARIAGGDAIAEHLAGDSTFGNVLVLTSESRWTVTPRGDSAEYAFETILVDLGGNDPAKTLLSDSGAQTATVRIVAHTNSTGIAERAADGRWAFRELNIGHGPLSLRGLAQEEPGEGDLPVGDELGFRRMRERFHLATTSGDRELLRSVWADDAVFRGGPNEIFGGDAVTDFMAGGAAFGRVLVLTPEYSARLAVNDGIAQYAFECITIDVGDGDPLGTPLCTAGGEQNPEVEIVRHTHTSGFAKRVADGKWVFQEFNGGLGPLPSE